MRKLVINQETWQFKVGSSHVRIKDPSGRSYAIPAHEVAGVSVDTWERGQYKKTSDGMLGPGKIRQYIDDHLVDGCLVRE